MHTLNVYLNLVIGPKRNGMFFFFFLVFLFLTACVCYKPQPTLYSSMEYYITGVESTPKQDFLTRKLKFRIFLPRKLKFENTVSVHRWSYRFIPIECTIRTENLSSFHSTYLKTQKFLKIFENHRFSNTPFFSQHLMDF